MEVKKPLTDKIAHILHFQDIGREHRNPLGAAATDHVFNGFGAFKVRRLKPEQVNVARTIDNTFQRATVHSPAYGSQTREYFMAILTGINDQQTTGRSHREHDCSLAPKK